MSLDVEIADVATLAGASRRVMEAKGRPTRDDMDGDGIPHERGRTGSASGGKVDEARALTILRGLPKDGKASKAKTVNGVKVYRTTMGWYDMEAGSDHRQIATLSEAAKVLARGGFAGKYDGPKPRAVNERERAARVREAATPPAESRSARKAGESLGDYGKRLKGRDAQIEAGREAAKKNGKTTRSGKNAEFEKEHPRGRGGSWTLKAGGGQQDAEAVRAVQRKVGASADGKFGGQTAAKVRAYQAKNGLKVDGIVGAQTLAAMRGKKGVAPGAAKGSDFAEFAKRGKAAKGGRKVSEALVALADVDLDDLE